MLLRLARFHGGARPIRLLPGSPAAVVQPLTLLCRLQNLERAHESLVHTHHCARVVELSAVVRRREDGHQAPAREELVAILDDLVRPAHQVEAVSLEELLDDRLTKSVRDPSIVRAPGVHPPVGVGPQEIAFDSRVRDLAGPVDRADLVQVGEVRAEPAVAAEDLLVHHGGERQGIEAVAESLPQPDAKASAAFVVEAVYPVDGGALVVPSEQPYLVGVLHFQRHE
mmetsp:Transcript_14345/g.54079  ORF Transcript_14345/g.54079 Transcript_14345/m.54079 type:complete len:226 (+) Transcript_14345:306-983(+)